jgi:hypothetical protein
MNRSNISHQNILLNSKYLRCLNTRKTYLFLLGLTLSVGDIKLILATGIFTGTILFAYRVKNIKWKHYYRYFDEILTPQNKQLILSVSGAGILAISSYLILNIWTEIDNKWLAFGIIWQIIFSSMGVGFLGWKFNQKSSAKIDKLSPKFPDLIKELNANSPLERLWAINEIIKLWENHQLTAQEMRETQEYFSLLRDLETEIIIINKLNNILEKISAKEMQPLNFPQRIKQKSPLMVRS